MNFLSIKDHFENMIQILFPHDFRVYDGTEIHEASSCCVAITRLGKKVVFYAPDKTAHHEVNHVTGKFLAKLLISDGLGSELQGFVQNETLKNIKYILAKKGELKPLFWVTNPNLILMYLFFLFMRLSFISY